MFLGHCPTPGGGATGLSHTGVSLLLSPWNPEHPCTEGLQAAPPSPGSRITTPTPWLYEAVGLHLVHTGSDSCEGACGSLRGELAWVGHGVPWSSSNSTDLSPTGLSIVITTDAQAARPVNHLGDPIPFAHYDRPLPITYSSQEMHPSVLQERCEKLPAFSMGIGFSTLEAI